MLSTCNQQFNLSKTSKSHTRTSTELKKPPPPRRHTIGLTHIAVESENNWGCGRPCLGLRRAPCLNRRLRRAACVLTAHHRSIPHQLNQIANVGKHKSAPSRTPPARARSLRLRHMRALSLLNIFLLLYSLYISKPLSHQFAKRWAPQQ